MDDQITIILVSAAIGGIVSFIGAVINNTLEKRTKVDENLRNTRIAVYKILWKMMELLPKWPKSTDVTYEKLNNFSVELKDWYFNEGGMFLSEQARKAYGNLQEAVSNVVGKGKEGTVTDDEYNLVRGKCGLLRTEITKDLQSRSRTFLV